MENEILAKFFPGERKVMKIKKDIPSSSEEWFAYFSGHRNILEAISWEGRSSLTDEERRKIASSIREFQLGESSEGRNLNEFVKRYSEETGEPLYYESIKFFIREEQRHAQLLGLFMEKEKIKTLKRCFVDSVFRHLRRYAGLELSLAVLLTAEMISLVYYRALGMSTSANLLKKICSEILKDERKHLVFHCQRLALIRQNYPPIKIWAINLFQKFLLSGTCVAVWTNHRKVLSRRHSMLGFWRAMWGIYRHACRKMCLPQNQDTEMRSLMAADYNA